MKENKRGYFLEYTIHCVLEKESHLMFDSNFGKCGLIFKILSPGDSMYISQISTSPGMCCYTTL